MVRRRLGALVLGADGVLVGTRLWTSTEALVTPRPERRAIQASGDDTFRSRVYDIVRQWDWPDKYDARLVTNSLIEAWHGNESELSACLPETVSTFEEAAAVRDFDVVTPLLGEAGRRH